jgi:hypothetical protein
MADGVSLAIGTAILKQIYSDGVNEQINNETPALSNIKSTAKNITNVGGAGVAFVAHFGRNHGIGARNELEQLPAAGQQVYARGTTGLKSLYGAIQCTGQVMYQAKTNPQSFVDYVGEEMSRLKSDLAKDQNRQVYGDGTGTLAKVTAADTTTTVVEVDDLTYISIGMRIDILDESTLGNAVPTPQNTNYLIVTGIDETNLEITVSASVAAVAVDDVLVRSSRTSAGGTNSWNKEWTGFKAIISDTGTLYNIDPTVHPDWAATVLTTASNVGVLTELDLDNVVQNVRRKGSKPTRIITTPGVYRAYWNALEGLRQFVNKPDMNGGVSGGLSFVTPYGEIPMMTDFDAPKGVAWFPNDKELALNTNVGWEWIDEQGATWQKIPSYDGFIAEMRNYSELTTYRRNAHGKLEGIAEV